ncbi:MAG: GIY-YIG nuclease family protein [Methanobacterium sp.]
MATYCLLIKLNKKSIIKVGKFGKLNFKKGFYVYVGSALNSIDARIKRHLKNDKKLFWHIDYLLNTSNTSVKKVILERSGEKWECDVAGQISKKGIQITNFGSSDCKCDSHLFYFGNFKDAEECVLNAFNKFKLDSEEFID